MLSLSLFLNSLYSQPNAEVKHVKNLPVKKGSEDEDTQDAEGQDVKDVGQEHLPFTVQTILTLLIADGSQRRDCEKQDI